MKHFFCATIIIVIGYSNTVIAQSWAEKMAATAMSLWPDSTQSANWTYEQGVVLNGIEKVWKRTANGKYFNYIQQCMDHFIAKDGSIRSYQQEDYNIDHIKPGTSLLLL